MTKVFRDEDADLDRIRSMSVAILGYGSQGRAQALNLRDSGVAVRVGVRHGSASSERASNDGFIPVTIPYAVEGADVVAFCLPDVAMAAIYAESVRPSLSTSAALVFAHGFAIHYGLIRPEATSDVLLVAPMGAGPIVRERFEAGSGVPALVAVHQESSGSALETALAYGAGIGCGRIAMLQTTFREETESDLFGEQAVLCGGLPSLILAAFETAVAGGISAEVAYIACLHEVKLIADLIYARGLDGMVQSISQTAEWGAYQAGPRILSESAQKGLAETLRDIQSGAFARAWIDESSAGSPNRISRQRKFLEHPIHQIGRSLRPILGIGPSE